MRSVQPIIHVSLPPREVRLKAERTIELRARARRTAEPSKLFPYVETIFYYKKEGKSLDTIRELLFELHLFKVSKSALGRFIAQQKSLASHAEFQMSESPWGSAERKK